MGLFLEKPPLLGHPLFRWQDVLWWKMIARHHSKVHWTLGILRHFQAFIRLRVFPAPKQNPRPPQRQ
jgi:hypothetical protein